MRRSGTRSFLVVLIFGLLFGLVRGKDFRRRTERRTADGGGQKSNIPKLLHYIYLDGYDAFMNENQNNETFNQLRTWFNGCQTLHSHWDSLFWDAKMGRDLLDQHYSWFLPWWDAYETDKKRSQALRPFIMHHFGGLYLDFDIECYKAADDSLQHFDLIFQGTGNEGYNVAAMASAPGQEFWMGYAEVLKERGPGPFPGERGTPRYMTGTLAYFNAMNRFIKTPRPLSGYVGGVFDISNVSIKAWPIGEWYVPCWGADHLCIAHLESEETRALWDMSDVYGRHHFLETAPKKHIEHELKDFYVS